MKKKPTKPKEIVATVTEKEYRKQLASGLTDEEILRPGVHRFTRGSFAKRHGIPEEELQAAIHAHQVKIGVYIKLDSDILDFFKARAKAPGGIPYQTQINAALRGVMEGHDPDGLDINKLVSNEKLISAIAERVRELV